MKVDFIVVGQGLAGSVMSRLLERRGYTYVVFDPGRSMTSSKIAAGLVNPVTGRRFNMSWKFRELNIFSKPFYKEWEQELDVSLIHEMPIIRAMEDHRFADDVEAKTTDPIYREYIKREWSFDSDWIKTSRLLYRIEQAYRVDLATILDMTRTRLKSDNLLIEESVDYSSFDLNDDMVKYRDIVAGKVVFCEGAGAVSNPWFNYLPFQPTKGELFMLHQDELHPAAYKKDLLLIPYPSDTLWCGSLNFWNYDDELPSKEGEQILIEKLRRVYKPDLDIRQHLAAIRPTTRDRRPMIGTHPEYSQLIIFNGLGTKGTLLAPYFGNLLLNALEGKGPLMRKADIARFANP